MDNATKGEVIVATTNGSISCGFWGELLTTGAKEHGCQEAIIDGFTRDQNKIIEMKFPLFVKDTSPYDSKGRTEVIAYQVPIMCGNVLVKPGDIICADVDGISVISQEIEDKVIKKLWKKYLGKIRREKNF